MSQKAESEWTTSDSEADEEKKWKKVEKRPTDSVYPLLVSLSFTVSALLLSLLGPTYLSALTIAIQALLFRQLISLQTRQSPYIHTLSIRICWGMYMSGTLFLYGRSLQGKGLTSQSLLLGALVEHCWSLTFPAYLLFFCAYVVSMRREQLVLQLRLLATTHMLLIVAAGMALVHPLAHKGSLWWLLSLVQVSAHLLGRYLVRKEKSSQSTVKELALGLIGGVMVSLIATAAFLCARKLPVFGFWQSEQNLLTFRTSSLADCGVFTKSPWKSGFLPPSEFSQHAIFLLLCSAVASSLADFFPWAVRRSLRLKDCLEVASRYVSLSSSLGCQLVMNILVYCFFFHWARQSAYAVEHVAHLAPLLSNEELALFSRLADQLSL